MKKTEWLATILVMLFVMVGIITISCLFFYKIGLFSTEALTLTVSVCDVLSSIVAGAFIVVQLRSDSDADLKHARTEEARFILEYNMAFIENSDLCEIEHYLEDAITHQGKGNIKNLRESRQKLVNYLVYLEGFASCVQQGILGIKEIDNLFSYRFFLAMNHPEVQELEILPFADFYRGNYQLYEEWYKYRMKIRNKDYLDDLDNCKDVMPLASTALIKNCNYEKYLNNSIVVAPKIPIVGKEDYTALFKYNGCSYQYSMNTQLVTPCVNNTDKKTILSIKKDKELMRRLEYCVNKKAAYIDNMHLYCKQINSTSQISNDQYICIADLIYNTDPYIYPALFGEGDTGVGIARELIPELIKENKDSMFCCNNLFLCYSKNRVIGLILWKKGHLVWHSEHLINKAKELNIDLNIENIRKVQEQYVTVRYSETMDSRIDIINACVLEEFRGLGIGKKLLCDFIKSHNSEAMHLCVLSNNEAAIKLYETYGFKIERNSIGFSLDDIKPNCYDMIRFSSPN